MPVLPASGVNAAVQRIAEQGGVLGNIPAVITHRGGWGPALQNTIENFRASIRAGANAVELDVRSTLDNVLVVHHDARIAGVGLRTTRYAALPLLEDGSKVATFDDVLGAIAHRTRIDVELKEFDTVPQVLAMLDKHGLGNKDFITSSFDLPAMIAVKQLRPDVQAGLLAERTINGGRQGLNQAHAAGLDFFAPRADLVNNSLLERAYQMRMPVVPWSEWVTSDARRSAELLADHRIAGLIVNERESAVAARNAIPWRNGD